MEKPRVSVVGDTRQKWRYFPPGKHELPGFAGEMEINTPCEILVTQEFRYWTDSEYHWVTREVHLETVRPPPPGRLARLWRWIRRVPPLPEARVIK